MFVAFCGHGVEDFRADDLVLREQDLRHVMTVYGVRFLRMFLFGRPTSVDAVVAQLLGNLFVLLFAPRFVEANDVGLGFTNDFGELITLICHMWML